MPTKIAIPTNQVKANLVGTPETENITKVIMNKIAVPPKSGSTITKHIKNADKMAG